MKQGRADRSGPADRKIEPRSTAINPGGVDAMGQVFGNHASDGHITNARYGTPLDAGRGYSAPGIGTTVHKSGSQGKR
jgi:hypothetical protein